jgi:hypothetical protein
VIAEELGHDPGVAGLGAARAGAGELQIRLAELAEKRTVSLMTSFFSVTVLAHHVIEHGLLGAWLSMETISRDVGGAR